MHTYVHTNARAAVECAATMLLCICKLHTLRRKRLTSVCKPTNADVLWYIYAPTHRYINMYIRTCYVSGYALAFWPLWSSV